MAINFRAAGTWTAGTTSIAPPLPSGVAAGDLMLLAIHTPNQAVSAVTNWTQVTGSPVSTGTAAAAGGTRLTLYYRFWQSGDTAPTVAVTGGNNTQARIFAYSGVDTTTPFDATPVSTTLATASTALTLSAIVTSTTNAMIFWAVARDIDAASTTGVTAFTNANLTSITERNDQTVTTGVGGGLWVGEGRKATAGTTGTTAVTQTSSIAVGLTLALRKAEFTTTGILTGQGSAVVGSADRQAGTVTHDTTGSLAGQGSSLAGAASRFRAFATSGGLSGQGSSIAGAADRQDAPAFVTHDTTGTLAGQNATVNGTARRNSTHATTGALSGAGSSLSGAAARSRLHGTAGILAGAGSSLAATAARFRAHGTTAALAGSGALLSGAAVRVAAPVLHAASGALAGPGAVLSGMATVGDAAGHGLYPFARRRRR